MNHWVLRCAITGDAFASQNAKPENSDDVEYDGRLCCWCEERAPAHTQAIADCPVCHADTINGVCTYNTDH